jgi:hypothetical protein
MPEGQTTDEGKYYWYDLSKGPENIRPEIQKSIADALGLAETEDTEKVIATFNFPVPRDTHLIPLFEKQLFEQLTNFHNKNDTELRQVDLLDLMSLDPELPKLTSQDGMTRGELTSEHELAHFFVNADGLESPEFGIQGRIVYELAWVNENNRMVLKTNACYKYFPENESIDQKIDISLNAPRYPSQSDVHDVTLRLASERDNALNDKIFTALEAKAKEQGGKRTGDITLHAAMLTKLFNSWKSLRQGTINFPDWWQY